METERSTDVGTPSVDIATTGSSTASSSDLGEIVDPTDVTDEVDVIASTIVIPDFERRAEAARASADLDEIQYVQDEYNDERHKRAERIIKRKRDKEKK